ncbi:type IV pilin protein [Eubacterium pyruvativorans]|uniref:type IV pilin protein n=1 Tax=Eubacterium pyruvativorans TaxID=155865 RepID=UPI0023F4BC75|nr:prepilin-type N-terminal cleavage/methylation domain-containing protein [Eubacterium pyruvativorans]MCI5747392.1 prepilin-type N-terminal cleavage/methylation domain-containing protein [Eubacterium pyruvativorans]
MKIDRKNEGFTLAELLIVVAIIAVLVAISIPIFTSQLEKSRIAADRANVRSAKAAAAAAYMSNGESGSASYVYNDDSVTKIDLTNSMDLDKKVSASGYGKSTKEDTDGSVTGAIGTPKDSVVEVTINGSDITARWIQGLLSYDPDSKILTFSEKNLTNQSIREELNRLEVSAEDINQIVAPEGSKIEDNTASLFKGFNNLKKVDLSKAVLEHSSFDMYANMPDSVNEIVLPKLASGGYDIQGRWYTADGTWNKSRYYDKVNGTRISASQSGQTIYKKNPKA